MKDRETGMHKRVQERKKGELQVNIERLLCSLDRREETSGGKRIKVAGGKDVKQILKVIMVILT